MKVSCQYLYPSCFLPNYIFLETTLISNKISKSKDYVEGYRSQGQNFLRVSPGEINGNQRKQKKKGNSHQFGQLNVSFIWYPVKKGRNTLNTMHVARPRLRGEVMSGTVDYIY